jgi:Mediator complex protein.
MERIQVLDQIEKDIITCLQSAGKPMTYMIWDYRLIVEMIEYL